MPAEREIERERERERKRERKRERERERRGEGGRECETWWYSTWKIGHAHRVEEYTPAVITQTL